MNPDKTKEKTSFEMAIISINTPVVENRQPLLALTEHFIRYERKDAGCSMIV